MFLDEKIEAAIPQGANATWNVIRQEINEHKNEPTTLKRIANTWKLVIKKHKDIDPNWLYNICIKSASNDTEKKYIKDILYIQ